MSTQAQVIARWTECRLSNGCHCVHVLVSHTLRCTPAALLQARNAALRREKELMARHYAQLKAALDRGRAAAAERLKQLSVMSGTAMQVRGKALLAMAAGLPASRSSSGDNRHLHVTAGVSPKLPAVCLLVLHRLPTVRCWPMPGPAQQAVQGGSHPEADRHVQEA